MDLWSFTDEAIRAFGSTVSGKVQSACLSRERAGPVFRPEFRDEETIRILATGFRRVVLSCGGLS